MFEKQPSHLPKHIDINPASDQSNYTSDDYDIIQNVGMKIAQKDITYNTVAEIYGIEKEKELPIA